MLFLLAGCGAQPPVSRDPDVPASWPKSAALVTYCASANIQGAVCVLQDRSIAMVVEARPECDPLWKDCRRAFSQELEQTEGRVNTDLNILFIQWPLHPLPNFPTSPYEEPETVPEQGAIVE